MLDHKRILPIISLALEEDIGSGDVTSKTTLPPNLLARATIQAKKPGIICGLEVARLVFEQVDPDLEIIINATNGDQVEAGQNLMSIEGKAASLMTAERVALNFLNVLSGTATLTKQFVEKINDLPVKILDTRKTIPGMRYLQKHAVKTGGGSNHRIGLYDMILIKDNHIAAAGSLTAALEKVSHAEVPVEVECETLDQVKEALPFKPDWIMLDNMNTITMEQAVQLINKQCKIEASGGVNLDTIRSIAEAGVDAISIGALTHSSHNNALDISMDIVLESHGNTH